MIEASEKNGAELRAVMFGYLGGILAAILGYACFKKYRNHDFSNMDLGSDLV